MSEHSDDILLEQLRGGDHSVYEKLYRKYFENLTMEAQYLVGSWDVAKDVVQSVFIIWLENDTLRKLSQRQDIKLKAYMKKSVRYYASRYLQRERNLVERGQKAGRAEEQAYEIVHELGDVDHMVRKFLNDLKPMPKNMLTEVYLNEYKIKEVALMYGLSTKVVRNYLYNGLKNLKLKLKGKIDHRL